MSHQAKSPSPKRYRADSRRRNAMTFSSIAEPDSAGMGRDAMVMDRGEGTVGRRCGCVVRSGSAALAERCEDAGFFAAAPRHKTTIPSEVGRARRAPLCSGRLARGRVPRIVRAPLLTDGTDTVNAPE